jgi:serine/threonine-protein kinase
VSWYEAAAYAAWTGVRLPTGEEWEFAACGPEAREYPWGNQLPDPTLANYSPYGPGHPTPVGLYPAGATPEGVLDLAGNVWEWVDEWYDQNKTERVIRGGSWFMGSRYLQAAYRLMDHPDYRDGHIGFRVVRAVPA